MVVPSFHASVPVQAEALLQLETVFQSVYLLLFLAGIGLMVAEAMAPGTHVFVLGIGFLTAGIVGMLLPAGLGIVAPLIIAVAVLAVTGAALWGYQKTALANQDSMAETSDSNSLRGQFGTVTEDVTASSGEVKLEDGGFNPYYQARSRDGTIPEGEEVMVLDPGGGNVVTVEAVSNYDDIDRALERERERSSQSNTDATDERNVESDRA